MALLSPPVVRVVLGVVFYLLLVAIVGSGCRAVWLSRKVTRTLGDTESARLLTFGLTCTLAAWFTMLAVVTPLGPEAREIRALLFVAALELEALALWTVGSGLRLLLLNLRSVAGRRARGDGSD